MGLAIKSLESSGYSDRIIGEETWSCTGRMVNRDVIAGVHGRGMAAVWLLYGCCMAAVWLMYGCSMAAVWLLHGCCMSAVSWFWSQLK